MITSTLQPPIYPASFSKNNRMRYFILAALTTALFTLGVGAQNECACAPGTQAGTYCGYCGEVTDGKTFDHAYFCDNTACTDLGADIGQRAGCNYMEDKCPIVQFIILD